MPTSEIEILGEESTELSEVNDIDRDDVDSSNLLHTSSNTILLRSSCFMFFYPVSFTY